METLIEKQLIERIGGGLLHPRSIMVGSDYLDAAIWTSKNINIQVNQ